MVTNILSWPTHEQPIRKSAAAWLLAAFLLLATWDAYVYKARPGFLEQLEPGPRRLAISRFVGPVLVISLLPISRRVWPREMGFTWGDPRATLAWCFGPLLLGLAAFALLALALAVLFQITGWRFPAEWLQLTAIGSMKQWQEEWPWQIYWWCLQAPLLEEPVHRAIPYAALLPFIGKRWTILALALIWSLLHWWYGWSLLNMPYYFFFWGILVTWIYSKTQSLATTITLHGVLNFIGPLLVDLTILTQRSWLKLWFAI